MPPASFVSLPIEILLMICETLCAHCSEVTPEPHNDSCNSFLYSLMLTCRQLRDVAQPVLYHWVRPGKNLSFLRTVIERPDLAAQVRCFFYKEANPQGPSDEEIEMLQTEARRLGINESDEWIREWAESAKDIGCDGDQRLLKLMLARLPKTEYVSVEAIFFKGTPCLEDSQNNRIVWKSIRRLLLCPTYVLDLGSTSTFLSMMPCVQHLTVYDCASITKRLPLAELQTLILKNSLIDATSLQNIIDSCPKLEHFEYHIMTADWSDYNYIDTATFTWGEAQRILHSRRTTLKHLNFEFGEEYSSFVVEPPSPADLLGSFCDFDRLETLWVRITSFGTEDGEEDGEEDEEEFVPTFPRGVQDLVNMLPQSLTCLGFCGQHFGWDGVVETLADAILQGHFPRLRVLLLEQEREEFESSCEIFADADIDLFCIPLDDSLRDAMLYFSYNKLSRFLREVRFWSR